MSMTQTTASGARLTMIAEKGTEPVTQDRAESWLRLRQSAQRPTNVLRRMAS